VETTKALGLRLPATSVDLRSATLSCCPDLIAAPQGTFDLLVEGKRWTLTIMLTIMLTNGGSVEAIEVTRDDLALAEECRRRPPREHALPLGRGVFRRLVGRRRFGVLAA
jgi:hypothetical protein